MMECRLCLNKSPSKCIFSLPYKFTHTIISLLNIIKDDGLPELICKGCVRKVKNTDDFIRKCEESNTVLRSRIVLDIKYEPDEKELKCEVQTSGKDLVVDPIKVEEDRKSDCYNSMVDSGGLKHKSNNVMDDKTTIKSEKIVTTGDGLNVKKNSSYSGDFSQARLCSLCGLSYKNRYAYKLHLKKHSKDEFQCDFCSKTFNQKTALKKHMKMHAQERRYSCRFCEKSFKYKNYVRRHEQVIHIKTKPDFKCLICGKEFFAKNYLKTHMGIHNGVRNIQCHICSKTFLRKDALKKHLSYHSDERPFVCRFCPNAFKNAEHRKKHERLHTGETPHRCPVCLKGFAQKCNMRSHFVHNHKELDFKETMTQFQTKNQETQQGTSVT